MRRRSTNERRRAHNDADVMFARSMVPDDQQAIQMSDIVLGKQDVDQRIIDLAGQIKTEQAPQVDQLTGWLSRWGNPPMPSSSGGEISGDGSSTPPAIAVARDENTGGRFLGAVQLARSVVATDKQNVDLMRNLLSHM
jgi:uncharacterized protein (DUF305 family)